MKTIERWAWKVGFLIAAWRWPEEDWVPYQYRKE